jgi:CBS domain-containing protein
MRRVNIQAAFIGEPSAAAEGLDTLESDEAVTLLVRGGELTLVVPAATPDDRVLDRASHLRGTLHLENERVLTLDIHVEADGAYWEHEPAALHERREQQASGDLFRAGAPLFAQPAAASASVRAIMTGEVVTVAPTATAQQLAELLAFHRISGVPVVAGGQLVGVVTESDLISRAGATVRELMTSDVVAIGEDATVADAAGLIAGRRVHRLPVVRGGQVVGLVSRADIVRWLAGSAGDR